MSGGRSTLSRPARTAVWFVALVGIWALLVGDSAVDSWIAAGLAAAVAAASAYAVMRRGLLDDTFHREWWGPLARALGEVPVDAVVVAAALFRAMRTGRREIGEFVAADIDAGGDTSRGRSWRGFVTFASSWSPNAYVIDIDRDTGRRLTHDLVPRAASERPA